MVVKLSVVERRARQHLKVHIKAYLIHALHFKINVMCKVKVRLKVAMKRFHILGYRVDYTSCKELTHTPKVLGYCPRRILHAYEGHTYKGHVQVTKGPYKIKVTNIPCNTDLLGHFARKYRW